MAYLHQTRAIIIFSALLVPCQQGTNGSRTFQFLPPPSVLCSPRCTKSLSCVTSHAFLVVSNIDIQDMWPLVVHTLLFPQWFVGRDEGCCCQQPGSRLGETPYVLSPSSQRSPLS